jgi:hypothetical protein
VLLAVVAESVLLTAQHIAYAQPTDTAAPPAQSAKANAPYCGVHALYAAMRLEGRSIEIRSLLDPTYIGTAEGSSVQELCTAPRGITACM